MIRRRECEGGFTLIEVLVALVVTSLLLAAIFQASTLALDRLRIGADRRVALLVGRYLLTRGTALGYGAGNASGSTDGLDWVSRERLVAGDPRGLVGLMRIDVALRDGQGHMLFDRSALRLKALPQR